MLVLVFDSTFAIDATSLVTSEPNLFPGFE